MISRWQGEMAQGSRAALRASNGEWHGFVAAAGGVLTGREAWTHWAQSLRRMLADVGRGPGCEDAAIQAGLHEPTQGHRPAKMGMACNPGWGMALQLG